MMDFSKPKDWTPGEKARASKALGTLIRTVADACDEDGQWLPDCALNPAEIEVKRKALSLTGWTNEEYDESLLKGEFPDDDVDEDDWDDTDKFGEEIDQS